MLPTIYFLFSFIFLFLFRSNIYYFLYHRYRLYKHLHQIQGPFALPLLGCTWQFKWKPTDFLIQFRDWVLYYRQRGNFLKMWLGPFPVIFVMRPEAAKVILESNTLIAKGSEYDILIPWLGTGLLIATGDKWRTRRKLLTPSFHYGILNKFMPVFNKQSKIFLDQIQQYSNEGAEFDVFPYIKRCALDIICETAMGCTISAQTNHEHPYVNSVQCMNEIVFKYQRMPWLRISPIWWLSGTGYNYEKHLKVLTEFTKSVIQERLETSCNCVEPGKKAFLDTLIELSKNGNLSDEDIREEVDTFMFEGHDTTSAGIGWALWCLACHQDCQQKVLDEIDEIFPDVDRAMEQEDLPRLTYLDRCVKEALRMRPPVPGFTRTVNEDLEVDGTLIPKGCSIVISPHIMHMHHELYENFLEFNPDRFLEEEVAKRHPYAYIPFSAGPRNCIGQKFAVMEEKTVLAWFFRRYRISCSMQFLDNLPRPEVINRPSKGFPVTIEKRFKF